LAATHQGERYPLYAYHHPSRHLPPAKVFWRASHTNDAEDDQYKAR
jgi:hypothetical protein